MTVNKISISHFFIISLNLTCSFIFVTANSFALEASAYVNYAEYQNPVVGELSCCSVHMDNDGTIRIIIKNAELEALVTTFINDVSHHNAYELLSQNLLLFCDKILNGESEFSLEEIQQALSELIAFASGKIENIRAPRPDAPGNTNGAPVGTLLECDLSQIEQLMNRLAQIVIECCAMIQLDFQFTWTILADIKQTITTDFNGTFTFLNEIYNTVTTCCATLELDFEFTWTILADIKQTITNDFNGTFTVLNEINDTLTTCCAMLEQDFEFTWTILADIKETITNDFNGTFTVLASFQNSVCSPTPITTPTIITVPGYYCLAHDIVGTVTISATDVTFDLNNHTISAPSASGIFISNAVNAIITDGKIDNTSIGVEFSQTNTTVTLSNILISNCSSNAIQFDSSTQDGIILQDIIIDSCATGINGSVSNSQFNDIIIRHSTGIAISSTLNGSVFKNIQVVDCGNNASANSAYLLAGSNNQLINCSVIQFVGERGFNLSMNDSILMNCTVQDLGPSALIGITTVGSDMIFQDCSVLNMSGSEFTSAVGISSSGANALFQNCLVQSVQGIRPASSNSGFQANNVTTRFIGCKAHDMLGFGFFNSGASAAIYMENCEAANNTLDGFVIVENTLMKGCTSFGNRNGFNVSGPGVSLLDCEAANNGSDGFFLTTNNIVIVGNCASYGNGGNGFNNNTALALPMYGCFATQNATNYTACPNTQNANTQVDTSVVGLTGPFARGNDFI